MMRPSRKGLTVLVLAAAVSALPACGALSQTTTTLNYDAADGVSAQLGDVQAKNLVVVGDKGADGLLSGALVNTGQSDVAVTIATKGLTQSTQITVPPGQLVTLGSGSNEKSVVVSNVAAPGSLVQVTLSTPSGGQVQTQVPVVLPRFDYATVTPTAD